VDVSRLRPLERRIVRWAQEGVPHDEIGRRFRRGPDFVEQVIMLASLPDRHAGPDAAGRELRPLERRILDWRAAGASHAEIAPRFRRSESFVARVEELARYKLDAR